jgi:hypothetical protein
MLIREIWIGPEMKNNGTVDRVIVPFKSGVVQNLIQ